MSGGNIKVVVRCRPLNSRELARGAKGLIRMEGNQTILEPPELAAQPGGRAIEKKPQVFSFDKSYWSAGPRDEPQYASQQTLYDDLGVELLDHSFEGFNTCIFAYGQTGSGKSYSMMGYGQDKGIIPLTTLELFRRVEERAAQNPKVSYSVEVSYIEIYNEKVRDLLNPKNKGNLRVREHPSLGPYVEDLSRLVVENYSQMMTLMDEGNKARTVASTNMNETSSRSHAVFTLILTQKHLDTATNMVGEKVSKISLVDLAGSERQASTGATGTRLKEGANINKSLTTLGKVIAALAQSSSEASKGKKKKEDFVPYRDSVLTWLLKESLGGNSKTAMIAAISPADYEETLSTLRYADAAKRIKTHAVVNEDPNAKLIRELKEELEMLRSRVIGGGSDEASFDPSVPPEKQMVTFQTKDGEIRTVSKLELQDQLQASEKLMDSLNLTWEEKMAKTQAIHVEREQALEELGITINKSIVGVHAPQKHPSLVNLNEDPLMSECLVYQLKPGETVTGSLDSPTAHIRLSGLNIAPEHCLFVNTDGVVTVQSKPDARSFVNGKLIDPQTPVKLLNDFRVILGDFHVFRFNDPEAVRAQRAKLPASTSLTDLSGESNSPMRSDSPYGRPEGELMDWSAARREVADIAKMGDQDLDKLFDDIVKVRTQRRRPDSRADFGADTESRLLQTEDSSDPLANPWSAPDTIATSLGVASLLEHDKLRTPPTSPPTPRRPTEDHVIEHQHLTKQLRSLAQEVRRIRSQAAISRVKGEELLQSIDWSADQLLQARRATQQWKRLRNYRVSEQILRTAVEVKTANVIAKQAGRKAVYNLAMTDSSGVTASSALETFGSVGALDNMSHNDSTDAPVVAIKVIDFEAKAVYLWSLDRFGQQLSKMRQIANLKLKPGYSVHFATAAAFSEEPSPTYSLIGTSRFSLRLLTYQSSHIMTVPIFCRYTMEAIGSCRIDIRPQGPHSSGYTTPESLSTSALFPPVPLGAKLHFSLTMTGVKGLTSADFVSVHAQAQLSTIIGPSLASEDTFASLPIELDKTSVAHLNLRRTISTVATADVLEHLSTGYGTIQFFAQTKQSYLQRQERFDLSKHAEENTEAEEPMRKNEADFLNTQNHHVLSSIKINELASDGRYRPADVENDVVQLHQGVQRQIQISFTHTSGRALAWTEVIHVSSSGIRISKGDRSESVAHSSTTLRLSSSVEFPPDGTSKLEAIGPWDTASYQCAALDQRTPSEERVTIHFTILVALDTIDEPAAFHVDLPVKIVGRDSKRSSLLSLWKPKPFLDITFFFVLKLVPPLARSTSELWKLDTARQSVEGQDVLGEWRARSLSLVTDYNRLRRVRRLAADVQATRSVMSIMDMGSFSSPSDHSDENELVQKYLDIWQRELEYRVEFNPQRSSRDEEALLNKLEALVPGIKPRLVPYITEYRPSVVCLKSGVLQMLSHSSLNEWNEGFFDLRGPCLFVHPDVSQRPNLIIDVSDAKIVGSPDVEMLLGRRYAFTIFTPTNSYIMQATNGKDLEEWMGAIQKASEAG